MSDVSEKIRGVKFLPLFPLPVVLMPYELMPLHIFEPRYRKMLSDIRLENNLFGLSYFNPAETDLSVPEIGSIGCVAEVREAQTLADGRSNILTMGIARYVLEEYAEVSDESYLVGKISFFEDDEENADALKSLTGEVSELFIRIASAAQEIAGERGRLPDLSSARPQELSFLIAAAFNFNAELKYELLKTRSTVERLEKLRLRIQESVDKIEDGARLNKIAKTNGHGGKKIDF